MTPESLATRAASTATPSAMQASSTHAAPLHSSPWRRWGRGERRARDRRLGLLGQGGGGKRAAQRPARRALDSSTLPEKQQLLAARPGQGTLAPLDTATAGGRQEQPGGGGGAPGPGRPAPAWRWTAAHIPGPSAPRRPPGARPGGPGASQGRRGRPSLRFKALGQLDSSWQTVRGGLMPQNGRAGGHRCKHSRPCCARRGAPGQAPSLPACGVGPSLRSHRGLGRAHQARLPSCSPAQNFERGPRRVCWTLPCVWAITQAAADERAWRQRRLRPTRERQKRAASRMRIG